MTFIKNNTNNKRREYGIRMGDDVSFYTGAALDITHGTSMASTNNHNSGQVTSVPSVFNDNTFTNNNAEFAGLNMENGDDSSLVFDRSDNKIYIYDKDGKFISKYPATNIPDSKSNGKWPNGNYKFSWYSPHKGDTENDAFGKNGNFIFNTDALSRGGMGVHSGRANRKGWRNPTDGCVRTTGECTTRIKEVHKIDPLTDITIQD